MPQAHQQHRLLAARTAEAKSVHMVQTWAVRVSVVEYAEMLVGIDMGRLEGCGAVVASRAPRPGT